MSEPIKVAYHQGPETMAYAGRSWVRGQPQPMNADQFAALMRRNPANPFDFKELASVSLIDKGDTSAKPARKSTRRKP